MTKSRSESDPEVDAKVEGSLNASLAVCAPLNNDLDPDRLQSASPATYAAACSVLEATNDVEVVLNALTLRDTCEQRIRLALNPVAGYLMVILAIGLLGSLVYLVLNGDRLRSIEQDLQVIPGSALALETVPSTAPSVASLTGLKILIGITACAFVVGLVFRLRGQGFVPVSMTSALRIPFLTKRDFVSSRRILSAYRESAALNIAVMLIDRGGQPDRSVHVSCDLIGMDDLERERVHAKLNQAATSPSLTATMKRFAIRLEDSANNHLTVWSRLVPLVVLVLLGGGYVMVYSLCIFGPAVRLFQLMTWGDS
ncbi:MAG: hypothetical protein AAGD07_02210 [Planctomycetota bacterium]